jgi:tetratricopeptide (TPR) repeat protein
LGEGASDEMVAFGALTGDKAMISAYLERAIKRLKENARAEDVPRTERAMRAIAAFGSGDDLRAFELGISNGFERDQVTPLAVAGMAALRMQRWDDAVKIFETLKSFAPRIGLSPQQAICRIQLARAYAGLRRTADARKAYEEAFAIWKNADTDLPILVEARKEHAALGS